MGGGGGGGATYNFAKISEKLHEIEKNFRGAPLDILL